MVAQVLQNRELARSTVFALDMLTALCQSKWHGRVNENSPYWLEGPPISCAADFISVVETENYVRLLYADTFAFEVLFPAAEQPYN